VGLTASKHVYPVLIMSVRWPARVDSKPIVSGHLSETDLRSVGSCTLCGGRLLMEVTHTQPFNGPLSGTTWVSQYQKGKTNLDFTEQETASGSGIS